MRTDAEAETPVLWPPYAESWFIGKDWCWEGLGTGEGDDRGWDGWMTSPTRWTWVWVNSGSSWWTGRPAVTAAKSLQSCPTLCDPIDGSPPGSPVPGILQAITLEWVAISFSNTGRPGVLQFMGSQRVRHDWATKLNWTEWHESD